MTQLRSQASAFGSNLSIVQNRQEFTKSMINTLQTGSDNLVLADGNEEAANLLALQTRQQLSTTALSLASQADQACCGCSKPTDDSPNGTAGPLAPPFFFAHLPI